jgi:hypothetical protein
MSAADTPTPSDNWEVIGAKAYNPGDPDAGAEESLIAAAPEAEARRVYADTVAEAADRGYVYVKLRSGGQDIENWPQATGWTS